MREPRFAIGAGYALYQGPSADSTPHRHAAFQIALAVRGEVAMADASGTHHHGIALIVPPMTRHRMLATESLLTFFVDPHCAFADRLRSYRGITLVPELSGLGEDVLRTAARPSSRLDPRLLAAMNTLADRRVLMPALAEGVGLSPQRLRALARDQLGLPLARWRVWLCLRRAAEALQDGLSLSEAAITGGFADQAHFTRQMREMMGVTPAAVLPVLRPVQSRRAT